jgi:hypothetical protein
MPKDEEGRRRRPEAPTSVQEINFGVIDQMKEKKKKERKA